MGNKNFFNGAFDIVPKKFDGLYSSSDVPAFEINTEKIEPNYFISYISRPSFYKSKENILLVQVVKEYMKIRC